MELWDASRRALTQAMARRLAVRQVTVTVDRLIEANLQLDLWEPATTAGGGAAAGAGRMEGTTGGRNRGKRDA